MGEVFAAGSCMGGVPHSNAGVFNPANLTIAVGDRIRFYTRMELLGGYNGTHDIRFTGSPANNVLLPISTNILARVTNVTTPPFAAAGSFPMECVDANHCFAFAELFSGWICNNYGVTVLEPLAIEAPELAFALRDDQVTLEWKSSLTDANSYIVEEAGEDFVFHAVHALSETSWTGTLPVGHAYYRVAAINDDGDMVYTNVVTAKRGSFTAAPEVAHDAVNQTVTVNLAAYAGETIEVSLCNLLGAHLKEVQETAADNSIHSLVMSTEGLATGVYLLKISAGKEVWHQRVLCGE